MAFRFPDGLQPTIDGDLNDWDLTGPPALSTTHFHDLVADADADPEDFDVSVWIGWNEAENLLYFAAEVIDDLHQVDRPEGTATSRIFLDDDMQVYVDADHSGGQYADFSELSASEQLSLNGTQAHHFILGGPHPDGDFFVHFSGAAWYALEDGPHTKAALSFSGIPGGPGVTRYELSVRPFDRTNVTADFLSAMHTLAEGQTLGFNLEFSDFDALSQVFDAKWSLSGGQNAFRFSERFADLYLLPLDDRFKETGVEAVTWARIKASFAPGQLLYLDNSSDKPIGPLGGHSGR
ncbi:MAG: hypothetical protein HN712_04115 [Gemmatimonadetes bacterium]|nr:hypothetical protein [Gemmatimonadota bacterium]MBT6148192.1 hypothetical protein [Gemmatimonadota bacterium]MBT7859468.1 hypothetical protein [Gemmatimonadota bacterium]